MVERGWLPDKWTEHGCEILRLRGIDEETYRHKTIKQRLMDAMAASNISALLHHAGCDEEEVAKRLVLHPKTANRWLNNEVLPHARIFFGLLVVVLRKEIDEVRLPRNRVVAWEAISRTIAIIREKECGGDRKYLSREEFSCVRSMMRHPHADELSPGNDEPDPILVRDVVEGVADQTRMAFPGGMLRTHRLVKNAIDAWAEPYVLFRLGLLKSWEFLDDFAV